MGVSVSGTRLFGKVDEVPGLGHVATKFFHTNLLPLWAIESWFVVAQNREGWVGVVIPTSKKSVAVARIRSVLLILMVFCGFTGMGNGDAWLSLIALACMGAFMGSFANRIAKADATRAQELSQLVMARFSEAEIVRVRMSHGLPVNADAMARVAPGETQSAQPPIG